MAWIYLLAAIVLMFAIALIYDYRAKKRGQSFDKSFDGTKDERQQNPQAQNDMHKVHQDSDFFGF